MAQTGLYPQRTEYLHVGFYVGIERTRRVGPQVAANINSSFYRGKQFTRSSRPDAPA